MPNTREPLDETFREFARATANRLSSMADYVRCHDSRRVMADVGRLVKNNPAQALVAAAAVGFLLGRSLSRE